jgi:zinc protease
VARRRQLFQIWIRPVRNDAAHFALRAAVRELERLVERGLAPEEFELTKKFLGKYYRHLAPTTMGRLGYRLDDHFYGLGESFLDAFPARIAALTRDEVNAAVKRHLQHKDLKIAMVTQNAAALRQALAEDRPSPMRYETPKPPEVLAEDTEIERHELGIKPENVHIAPVETMFR